MCKSCVTYLLTYLLIKKKTNLDLGIVRESPAPNYWYKNLSFYIKFFWTYFIIYDIYLIIYILKHIHVIVEFIKYSTE